MSLISSAFLICLYAVSSMTCLFGNCVVLLAIYQTKTLRTVSNFFIASLAVADISVGFFMNPILICKAALNIWQGNHWLSKLADFMWIQTTTSTTFNLCSVSIDRYVAITAVFKYHRIMTRKKCFAALTLIFLVCFCETFHRQLSGSSKTLDFNYSLNSYHSTLSHRILLPENLLRGKDADQENC